MIQLIIASFFTWTILARAEGPAATYQKKFKRSKLTYDQSEKLADHRTIILATGEDKAIDLDFDANIGVQGISYGNPQIVTSTFVRIGEQKQIIFKPLKAGETNVTIRDADGNIRLIFLVKVTGTNLLTIASEIRDLLRDVEGVEIRVVGPKVLIEGEVLVPNDYGRLLAVVQDGAYKDYVMNITVLSPMTMEFMARKIREDIAPFAPGVTTRVVNGMIFLEGLVDREDRARDAMRVASLYMPDLLPGHLLEKDPTVQRMSPRSLIQNFIQIQAPPPKKEDKLVRITAHFVQLSKDYNKLFGFKWQPGFTSDPQISIGQTANGSTGSAAPTFSGTISSLLPHLQSSQQAGFGRVLDTGTVIVRSGQPAKINEEQQLSYAMAGFGGVVSSATKNVGLVMAVTPLILGNSDDIQLDLELSQSTVIGKPPSNGPPNIASNKVSTKLYVKSNESAAVAGVTSSQVSNEFNKDDPSNSAFGGETQPLFTLIRTKNYSKFKTQFVVFITPEIIKSASDGAEDLKKNFRQRVK